MSFVLLAPFLDELEKIARTRYAREAGDALRSGDTGTLNQIAQAHQQLGLGQREVGPLGGGAEAGAFLNLGKAQGQTSGPNMHVEKFYNPESEISRGAETQQLVGMKKQFTDQARSLSPQARSIVPDMYGHQTINQGTAGSRTRSTHEFVPGASSLLNAQGGTRRDALDQVNEHVLNPMKAKGMAMGDTIREAPDANGDTRRFTNFGNVVHSPTGPKVLDFLPHQQGTDYIPGKSFGKYAPNEATDKFDMSPGQAKQEFYNPKAAVTPAAPGMQASAQKLFQAGGIVPDFKPNSVSSSPPPTATAATAKASPQAMGQQASGMPTRATAPAPTAAIPRPAAGALAGPAASAPSGMNSVNTRPMSSMPFRPTMPAPKPMLSGPMKTIGTNMLQKMPALHI